METEKRKVFDGDNLKIIDYFYPDETEIYLEKYRNNGKWEDVETDIDGDIVLFKKEF